MSEHNRSVFEPIVIQEAVAGTNGSDWKVTILQEGFNTSKSRFYEGSSLNSIMPMLEKLPAFLNHPTSMEDSTRPERSVEDIVGWYTNPIRDINRVDATLHLLMEGTKHPWLPKMVAEAMERGNSHLIGLSIKGNGAGEVDKDDSGRPFYRIKEILGLVSADIVTKPGAGGRIWNLSETTEEEIRELSELQSTLQSLTKEELERLRPDLFQIKETEENKIEGNEEGNTGGNMDRDKVDIVEAQVVDPVSAEMERLKTAVQEVNLIKSKMVLKQKISEADLPDTIKNRIQKRYDGKVFEIEELDKEILEEASVFDEIKRSFGGKSLDRKYSLEVTNDEKDKENKALEGMLWGQSIDGITPFRSIREAFCRMHSGDTGDPNLPSQILAESAGYGSSAPNIVGLRESNTVLSSTWSVILGEGIYRVMLRWMAKESRYDDWKKICSTISSITDTKTQRRSTIGGFNMPPAVAEGGTYQEDTTPAEYAVSFTPTKYGRLSVLTFEAIVNDDLGAVREIPKTLALGHKVRIYRTVFDLMSVSTFTGPSMDYDSTVLFHADHSNIDSNALSSANLLTGRRTMLTQVYPGTTQVNLLNEPKYILVPETLWGLAYRLVTSNVQVLASNFNATDPNPHLGKYEVVSLPYWDTSSTTAWILVSDPMMTPTCEVALWQGKDEPEIYTQEDPRVGSVFTADKITYKSRSIFAAKIVHHAGFYRGNA